MRLLPAVWIQAFAQSLRSVFTASAEFAWTEWRFAFGVRKVSPSHDLRQISNGVYLSGVDPTWNDNLPPLCVFCRVKFSDGFGSSHFSVILVVVSDPNNVSVGYAKIDADNRSSISAFELA